MVDFFTVPPVFVSVYLNRSWLGKSAYNSQLFLSLSFINPFFLFCCTALSRLAFFPCNFSSFFPQPHHPTPLLFPFLFLPSIFMCHPPFYHSLSLPLPLSPPSVSPLLGVCLGGPLAWGCSQLFLIIESDRAGFL